MKFWTSFTLTAVSVIPTQAAPALSSPAPALSIINPLEPSAPFNLTASSLPSTTSQNNTHPLTTPPIIAYRIPSTPTTLLLAPLGKPIDPRSLARTILETQSELRTYVTANNATNIPLALADDPYESSRRWTGAFFGVVSYPPGYQLLTYGVVMEVLQGLWLWDYRGGTREEVLFEVLRDGEGLVGLGRLVVRREERGFGEGGMVGVS